MRKKTTYEQPRLAKFGSIEELTKGPSIGFIDAILGVVGIGDGDGGYAGCVVRPQDCVTGS